MSYFEVGNQKHEIPSGESRLGTTGDGRTVSVGNDVIDPLAILRGQAQGQVIIYRASTDAEVSVNGVRLGEEPTPLLHGDKVVIVDQELIFVDELRGGSTRHVQAVSLEEMPVAKATPAEPAGRWQNGRVICLTDGREYQLESEPLTFGRDATSRVVVPGSDVSRDHAQLMETPDGYVLIDKSTNGTFVDDQRIQGPHLLQRGDRFRIGDEEFRFYADAAEEGAVETEEVTPDLRPTAEAPPPRPTPPPVPAQEVRPGPPRESGVRVLGRLIVRSEPLRGHRFDLIVPMINIGRAEFNDVVLDDSSVSTQHAKLQRREGIWMVVDLASTNGTFVDGERVSEELPLSPGAVIRFGNISVMFEPMDDDLGLGKLGSATSLIDSDQLAAVAGERIAAMAPPSADLEPEAGPEVEAEAKAPEPVGAPAAPAPVAPAPRPAPPVKQHGVLEIAIIVLLFAAVAVVVWVYIG